VKHALQCIDAQHLPGEQMVEEEALPRPSCPVPCGLHRTAGGTADADVGCSGHADGIRTKPGGTGMLPCERRLKPVGGQGRWLASVVRP